MRTFLALIILLLPVASLAGKHSISGQVVNRNGKPMEHVIVSLSPGNVELITDREGRFMIDYLRDDDGMRTRLKRRAEYTIELFKVGFHIETRSVFYKRGPAVIETVRMVEESIQVHDDGADLTESLDSEPTHSAGANYEGQ